ncbi:MAG TPA: acyl-CoA dehydrogenase family protein [Polyangiales bacterium]|nr:acyl-CoA dehydrogenase family protein [Polyangiales bacterium]
MDASSLPDVERSQRLQQIANEVVAPKAGEVDREARFPSESIAALREARLLGAAVPVELGGFGVGLTELAEMCRTLGASCASTGMVFAMHQIQLACLLRHGQGSSYIRDYLREVASRQLLIASVTSEVGIGGDMRSSIASVEPNDKAGFTLSKQASTISYGEHADDLLVTVRRAPDAPRNDQVLALLRRGEFELQKQGVWDTLGMRGTCSPAFQLHGRGTLGQIVPNFALAASATMVPYSHALWSSVWLGIASDAVSRAHSMVRAQARKTPGTVPPTASRLAEVTASLDGLRLIIQAFIAEFEALITQPNGGIETLTSMGFALRVNQLKVNTSETAVDIVTRVLPLCGIAGYRNDTPQSVGRHLRDVYSSILMIANDRILATNAQLLLVHKAT